ncbi:FAD dependent oxidoreductase [Massariosphaeria phaeospora]|uniref:L-2-hydroxyglutarate dehydrogenase, mitochondrial n=1 Tax=Massariosphaeria phaeospora TaxID=100035 RepID=A0A7C8I9P0_9PLEO|nr:FAD dependent oxidoreductase [Massariosphaeria phaeospora]
MFATTRAISTSLAQFPPRCFTSRGFSSSASKRSDFTHAVIGAGVVGLAVAKKLQEREGASTVLIERNGAVGMETSSRNSEVIHAGLHYPPSSLKATLCLRGKHLLYDLCARHAIPHRRTGKWIVAQDAAQFGALQRLHAHAHAVGVPTHFVSPTQAHAREPDVRAAAGVLESPSTGIVDSHALMQYLEGAFTELGGVLALRTSVVRIKPLDGGARGWEIETTTTTPDAAAVAGESETSTITADTLVNAAGLAAIPLANMLRPASRQRTPYYAKGTYYSYSASSPRPSTLIYPAPSPGHAGLGTHLTLDLSGRIRFGPDVEWTTSPSDYAPNAANLGAALDAIAEYLPGVRREDVGLDYVGIRPKMARGAAGVAGEGFEDFVIGGEDGVRGYVGCLGVESPGLTAALAVGEEVVGRLYR